MIDGVKFEVTAVEMADLFKMRAGYHAQRAAQQTEELPKLEKIIEGLKVPAYTESNGVPGVTFGNSTYAHQPDPVQDLKNRIASHLSAASKLEFYSKHVVPDETYRLTTGDLTVLGIEDPYWMRR